MYDLPVVHRLGCGRGHVFEEEVRLFEHIPEIKIVMRKIELIQIVLLHDRGRSTFIEVNIQQRPDCFWSVIPFTFTLYLK